MHISTIRAVEKSLRRFEYPMSAFSTCRVPLRNCSFEYADQSLAAGSVASYRRICVNRPCIGAAALSTVCPGLRRANTCTHRARRSSARIQPHSGSITGFIRIGTRICGDSAGSMPAKPAADTPTIVIG